MLSRLRGNFHRDNFQSSGENTVTASIDTTNFDSTASTQVIPTIPGADETARLSRDDLIRLAQTRAALKRAAETPTANFPVVIAPRTNSWLSQVLPDIEDEELKTERKLRRQERRRKTRWTIGGMMAFLVGSGGVGAYSYYTSSMDNIVGTILDLWPF
jgi:hypothetical protein